MVYQLGTPLKGVNGTVVFDGHFVAITRKGFMARATVGKGEKRIPLASITAVQWKPPGALVNGFIQFSLSGGSERRSQFGKQTSDAVQDENSVVIRAGQMEADFLALREAIEQAIVQRHTPAASSAPQTASQPSVQLGVADELAKLAALRDAGVLTDAEFAAQKSGLLAGSVTPSQSTDETSQLGDNVSAPASPADWYPDPRGEKRLRYWDGAVWTDHVAD